jgi:hypothetical protein
MTRYALDTQIDRQCKVIRKLYAHVRKKDYSLAFNLITEFQRDDIIRIFMR